MKRRGRPSLPKIFTAYAVRRLFAKRRKEAGKWAGRPEGVEVAKGVVIPIQVIAAYANDENEKAGGILHQDEAMRRGIFRILKMRGLREGRATVKLVNAAIRNKQRRAARIKAEAEKAKAEIKQEDNKP